jgi:hypothetical protein
LGRVDGFSGAFSKHGKLANFLGIRKGDGGLTFDDDDVVFRGILILFLVVVKTSALRRAAMGEFLPSSGDAVPVATFTSVVAGTAAFEVEF